MKPNLADWSLDALRDAYLWASHAYIGKDENDKTDKLLQEAMDAIAKEQCRRQDA